MTRWHHALIAAAAALSLPAAAAAQPTPAGPMTVERLRSGFQAAIDSKITDVDGHTSTLVGGQAGWVIDDAIFFGGGGYWLVNGGHDRDMGYGGFVMQFTTHASDAVGFNARLLLGGGVATLAYPYAVPIYGPGGPVVDPRNTAVALRPATVLYDQGFFVAEPDASVVLRLTKQVRVKAGVGYRWVSDYYYGYPYGYAPYGYSNGRLSGVTGTFGVQIF